MDNLINHSIIIEIRNVYATTKEIVSVKNFKEKLSDISSRKYTLDFTSNVLDFSLT